MYLIKITNKTTSETEMVVGGYPNQRDAQKYGILYSTMVMSGAAKPEDCDADIVDVTTQDGRILEWLEQYPPSLPVSSTASPAGWPHFGMA